jgi:hypothetical protein
VTEAFTKAEQIVIAELKDFAINTVTTLASTDLTNEEKRKQAIEAIKNQAKAEGKEMTDSLAATLTELAYSYAKKATVAVTA